MNGTLQSGQAIPSIRAMAKLLHISVITVQRAYKELQRDGFIETAIGRGQLCLCTEPVYLSGRAAASSGRSLEGSSRSGTHSRHFFIQTY